MGYEEVRQGVAKVGCEMVHDPPGS